MLRYLTLHLCTSSRAAPYQFPAYCSTAKKRGTAGSDPLSQSVSIERLITGSFFLGGYHHDMSHVGIIAI